MGLDDPFLLLVDFFIPIIYFLSKNHLLIVFQKGQKIEGNFDWQSGLKKIERYPMGQNLSNLPKVPSKLVPHVCKYFDLSY